MDANQIALILRKHLRTEATHETKVIDTGPTTDLFRYEVVVRLGISNQSIIDAAFAIAVAETEAEVAKRWWKRFGGRYGS